MIFYFHIQSNHSNYTISLIATAELSELYILTNSSINAGKTLQNQVKTELFNITKTRLFKYIENFTTKKSESFQIKPLIFFIYLLKTLIVGTR